MKASILFIASTGIAACLMSSCETTDQPYYGTPAAYCGNDTLQGIIVHGEQYYVRGGVYYRKNGGCYYRVANPYSSAVKRIY